MRVRQFTHGDLDGVACALVAANAFREHDHAVSVCYYGAGPNSVDVQLGNFLDSVSAGATHADVLLLTDICPSPEVCDALDVLVDRFNKVLLLDHHETSAWIAKFPWAQHETSNLRCGAQMLFDELELADEQLHALVRAADAYDRWILDSVHRKRGERLNVLYQFLGFREFFAQFDKQYDSDRTGWLSNLLPVLRKRQEQRIDDAVQRVGTETDVYVDARQRHYAFLPVSEFASEIGSAILEAFPSIEYVVMPVANIDVVTMRSRKGEGNADVAEIAVQNGGGGHQPAAGFPYPLGTILWNALSGAFE